MKERIKNNSYSFKEGDLIIVPVGTNKKFKYSVGIFLECTDTFIKVFVRNGIHVGLEGIQKISEFRDIIEQEKNLTVGCQPRWLFKSN